MTECYAMVRGSTLRATALSETGAPTNPVYSFVSKSATKVTLTEVTDGVSGSSYRDDRDMTRMAFEGQEDSLGFEASVDFLKVDPTLLSMMTSQSIVINGNDDVVGFDVNTCVPAASFALEVWSRLDLKTCRALGFGEGDFGAMLFGDGDDRKVRTEIWGYTLFPFLKGGLLSGFVFENGLVSFNVRGAKTHQGSQWLVGPYDLEGQYERLLKHVSGNGAWTTTLVYTAPPEPFAGWQEIDDWIFGGSVDLTSPDILAGGRAGYTSPWIISGGRA